MSGQAEKGAQLTGMHAEQADWEGARAKPRIIDDKHSMTLIGRTGVNVAVAWGPAVDNGEWFVRRLPNGDGYRVTDQTAARTELQRIGGLS